MLYEVITRHRLTHAHPHRTLDLAFDRQAIERPAAIMGDPDVVDRNHAGLFVDSNLDHLRGGARAARRKQAESAPTIPFLSAA